MQKTLAAAGLQNQRWNIRPAIGSAAVPHQATVVVAIAIGMGQYALAPTTPESAAATRHLLVKTAAPQATRRRNCARQKAMSSRESTPLL